MTINIPGIIKGSMDNIESELDKSMKAVYPGFDKSSRIKRDSNFHDETTKASNFSSTAPVDVAVSPAPSSPAPSSPAPSSPADLIDPPGENLSESDIRAAAKISIESEKDDADRVQGMKSRLTDNGEMNAKKLNDEMDQNKMMHFYLAIVEMMQKILTMIAKWCWGKMRATGTAVANTPKSLKDMISGIGAKHIHKQPEKPALTPEERLAAIDKERADIVSKMQSGDATKKPEDKPEAPFPNIDPSSMKEDMAEDVSFSASKANHFKDNPAYKENQDGGLVPSDSRDENVASGDSIQPNESSHATEGLEEIQILNDDSINLTDAEGSTILTKVNQISEELISNINPDSVKKLMENEDSNFVNKFISSQIKELSSLRNSFSGKADTLEISINEEIKSKSKLLNVDFKTLKNTILNGSDAENILLIGNDRKEILRKNEILSDLRFNADLLYVAAKGLSDYAGHSENGDLSEDQKQSALNIKNEFENLFASRDTSKPFVDKSQLNSFSQPATIAQSIEVQKEYDDSQGIESGVLEGRSFLPSRPAEQSALLVGDVSEIRNGVISQKPVDAGKLALIQEIFEEQVVAEVEAPAVLQDQLDKSNFSRPRLA